MSWDLVVKFNNQNWKPLSNESGYQITEKDKKRTFGFVDEEERVGFDMGKRAASKSVFCWFLEEIIDVFCANVRSPCFLSFSWGFCFLPHLSLVPNTLCAWPCLCLCFVFHPSFLGQMKGRRICKIGTVPFIYLTCLTRRRCSVDRTTTSYACFLFLEEC